MTELKRIVGLTGGMGAGKSTLVEIARQEGIKVFDCDALVHAIYDDEMFLLSLDELYGPIGENPRKYMGDLIAKDPQILSTIEELMKDFFQTGIREALQTIPQGSFLLMDAPILFETKMDRLCDFVIAIQCPREVRELRVMQRPNMTHEKMTALMDRQISEADRLVRSQYIIHNTGTLEEAQTKMRDIITHLKGFYA